MRRKLSTALFLLAVSLVLTGTEQRDILEVFCKKENRTVAVKEKARKALCRNQNVWMIVRPHQYRYLFRSRAWLDGKTGKAYRLQSPEVWSSSWAQGWDHAPFLILKYYLNSKEHLPFDQVEPQIRVLRDIGRMLWLRCPGRQRESSAKLAVSFSSPASSIRQVPAI